jgi:hypothetical protein
VGMLGKKRRLKRLTIRGTNKIGTDFDNTYADLLNDVGRFAMTRGRSR